jgi:predicted nucleotidyltransferase
MSVFLICEFDPLHHGHLYIMNKARELYPDNPLVCVMSGNFTQRGCPAVIDKYRRAKAAVLCGADLVLSIPFPWCSGSAEYFARGAISVIKGVYKDGDALIFGSECADMDLLNTTACNLDSPAFEAKLREKLESKTPYAAARQSAYEELFGKCEPLQSRNDILALEYIKAAKAAGLGLLFTPVKREGGFMSSSEIRKSADPASLLPEPMKNGILSAAAAGEYPASYKNFEKAIVYQLRQTAAAYAEGGYGIAERLSNAAKEARGIEELFEKAASSAYTDAKLRRAALYSLLRIGAEELKKTPDHTQLLAANRRGLDILADGKKTRAVTVVTKPADAPDEFIPERKADELYCMLTPKTLCHGEFLRRTPFILKEDPT